MTTKPIAWTIAGSDPGGGAGIQADLKTMNALGSHGCSVITALTAQNTQQVFSYEPVSTTMLRAQLDALRDDLPPRALKLGMLGNRDVVETVSQALIDLDAFVVYDPVMLATSGDSLMAEDTLTVLRSKLLPQVDLLTPNRLEAERLTGKVIDSADAMEAAAWDILSFGVQSVLIKGGHSPSGEQSPFCQDFWTDGKQKLWFTSPRLSNRNTHGTGCTLSAAITAAIALGYELPDALVIAKAYVNQGIANAPNLGQGHGPLAHLGWPEHEADLPWLTITAGEGLARLSFPDCGPTPLGFYPIVPRSEWLSRLLPLGVSTVQLRIKDLTGEALEAEIAAASDIARAYQCRLFVNDYWELALKYQSYGVHLGQEDLEKADLQALAQAGIRLGLSTHCYAEVARALAIRPSYMAIGPIHHTTTKTMRFAPQGLESLKRWRKTLDYPLVAIGGLFLENAPEALAAGADAIAVVRDIINAPDVPAQVQRWQALFEEHRLKTTEKTSLEIPLIPA